MNEENKKKKRFKLFDSQREGKGVTKEEALLPPGFKKFFILYKRDFSRLLTVNIFMVLGNFPALFFIVSQLVSTPFVYPSNNAFGVLDGLLGVEGYTAPLLALNGVLGEMATSNAYTPLAYLFMGLGALTFLTFGLVNVGTTYILRNMVKGEPVFFWSDFWYAIRRNLKQGFFFGIVDLLILILIPYNVWVLSLGSGFWNGILFWSNIVVGLLYLAMRAYSYIEIVTFDLSIYKILKNALIFAIVGFKRNACAMIGKVLLVFLTLAFA
ncbi:MAG: hypothetical protein J6S44_04120, partial [Clostridia bacterium]|nr:hypothetical protein [Clostridia bacterium]